MRRRCGATDLGVRRQDHDLPQAGGSSAGQACAVLSDRWDAAWTATGKSAGRRVPVCGDRRAHWRFRAAPSFSFARQCQAHVSRLWHARGRDHRRRQVRAGSGRKLRIVERARSRLSDRSGMGARRRTTFCGGAPSSGFISLAMSRRRCATISRTARMRRIAANIDRLDDDRRGFRDIEFHSAFPEEGNPRRKQVMDGLAGRACAPAGLSSKPHAKWED